MTSFPTYAFDESGKVVAFHGNQVIASGTDFEKVATQADQHFEAVSQEQATKATDEVRRTATHITTPNGTQGTILGRTAGLWSDEVTVRFDNGQIRRYATFAGDGLKYSTEEPDTPKSPVEYFERKLDQVASPGRTGLTARLNELEEIRHEASHLASQGVSYTDGEALHRVVLAANAERNEVREALDHLVAADAEAIEAPKMAYTAVEQADLGHSDSWLEVVAQEMIAESETQDYDKLLNEGPALFVSSLETGALDNAGVVRDLAIEHIQSKTAAFKGEQVEDYRDQFVASAELARKQELSYRKDVVKDEMVKEAKVAEGTPDEALFL